VFSEDELYQTLPVNTFQGGVGVVVLVFCCFPNQKMFRLSASTHLY